MRRKKRKSHKKGARLFIFLIFLLGFILALSMLSPLALNFFYKVDKSSQTLIKPTDSDIFLNLEKKLREKNIEMRNIEIATNSGVLTGELKNGTLIYFSQSKSAEVQASSLQLILAKLTIEDKKPRLIDLRFDKPVVKF